MVSIFMLGLAITLQTKYQNRQSSRQRLKKYIKQPKQPRITQTEVPTWEGRAYIIVHELHAYIIVSLSNQGRNARDFQFKCAIPIFPILMTYMHAHACRSDMKIRKLLTILNNLSLPKIYRMTV